MSFSSFSEWGARGGGGGEFRPEFETEDGETGMSVLSVLNAGHKQYSVRTKNAISCDRHW